MPSGPTFTLPEGFATILSRADLEHCVAWREIFRQRAKDHRFYEVTQRTLGKDFDQRYLLLQDKEGRVRAAQLFFVQQDLCAGLSPRWHRAAERLRRLSPRFLKMRALMVGCCAGEGHLGFIAPEDIKWVADSLHAALKPYARKHRASLVVLKDFPSSYRTALRAFSSNGYARIPSMPMTKMSLNFPSFENYLSTLGKRHAKISGGNSGPPSGADPIDLEVISDISNYVDEAYPLYLQVYDRSPLKFERLTKDFFRSIGQRMPDRVKYFIWRQNGHMVAFSLCFIHGGTIYDEYLGLDYRLALDLHLYFYTLRDIISWAIREGLENYCSSPLNYGPKFHLGFGLVPLDLYVIHTAGLLNPLFKRAVRFLEPTRHDKALRQFANVSELHA